MYSECDKLCAWWGNHLVHAFNIGAGREDQCWAENCGTCLLGVLFFYIWLLWCLEMYSSLKCKLCFYHAINYVESIWFLVLVVSVQNGLVPWLWICPSWKGDLKCNLSFSSPLVYLVWLTSQKILPLVFKANMGRHILQRSVQFDVSALSICQVNWSAPFLRGGNSGHGHAKILKMRPVMMWELCLTRL